MESKKCLNCDNEFIKKPNESRKDWETRHKFCSRKCSMCYTWKIGKGKTQFVKGMVAPNKGRVYTEKERKGMKLFEKGHTKVGTEHLKKWREEGGEPWNKGVYGYHTHGGSKAPLKMAIRSCQKNINWRSNILKRDNYTCLECGRKRKPGDRVIPEVDHVISFSQILIGNQIDTLEKAYTIDILWDESNGRTLCKECHKKTESHGSNQWK